jgi:hypothetical protein
MVEAADIKCPTCFVILPVKRTFAEDSTEGADNTPSDAEMLMDAVNTPQEVKDKVTSWLTAFCEVSSRVNSIADKVKKTVKSVQSVVEITTDTMAGDTESLTKFISKAFSEYVGGKSESLWLYLVDEATGEVVQPPDGSVYPIEITTPGETLPVLLPLAKIGLKAMCITNNVAKLGRAFGYPLPSLGPKYVNMAQEAIGELSKESSVAEFAVLQNHLNNVTQKDKKEGQTQEQGNTNTGKQDPETIRGAALREFERWLTDNDEQHAFCNLQRVLTSEGKSCWTTKENADNMEKGQNVLNGPEDESGDPKSIDVEVKQILEENELKRRLKDLGLRETPAEVISTNRLPTHLDGSFVNEGKCHSRDDTVAIDAKCTYPCMYVCMYVCMYACMYVCMRVGM